MDIPNLTNFNFCKGILIDLIINKFNSRNSILSDSEFEKKIIFLQKDSFEMEICFNQQFPALCGYHSLFNLLCISKRNRSQNEKENYYYNEKRNNVVKFWIFYRKITDFILKSLILEKPAVTQIKNFGALERYQIRHVIENYYKFKRISHDSDQIEEKIFFLFFAFGNVQSFNKLELKNLQESLERIKSKVPSEKTMIIYIILGITNHWSLVSISKKAFSIKIDFNYYDSLNLDVFNFKSEQEIDDFIKNRDIERIKHGKKGLSQFLMNMQKQWIIDINSILVILFDIVFRDSSLYELTIGKLVSKIINTYQDYLKIDLIHDIYGKKEIESISLNRILLWLKCEFHPVELHEEVIHLIELFDYTEDIKARDDYLQFKNWVIFNYEIITFYENNRRDFNLEESDSNLMKNFEEVILKLKNSFLI